MEHAEVRNIFRLSQLLRGIDHAGIEALVQQAEVRAIPDQTSITQRGMPGDTVFFILSGRCLGLLQSREGKDVVLERLGPGRIFGELSSLDGGSRVRSVRAQGPVQLACLVASEFNLWLTAHPQALRNLLSELAANARSLAERYYEMAVYDVETRVRLFLIRLLIEADMLRNRGTLDPAPSHSLIAAHVGANREAVSRAISRLNRSGLIDSGRMRIVVRDVEALEAEPQGPV